MKTIIVSICLGTWKCHPVVGSNHYNGIFQFTNFFEVFKHALQMQVKPFNFHGVIQNISHNDFMVGEKIRHINTGQCFIGSFPRILFEPAVGLMSSIPKKEGFVSFNTIDKKFKIGKIILIANSIGGSFIISIGFIIYLAVFYSSGISFSPERIGL